MKKIITLLIMLSVFAASAQNKQGAIKGVVTDVAGESVPFANVSLLQNGNQILGATTDFDGNYVLKPVPKGEYAVKFSFVGYQSLIVTGVVVLEDSLTCLAASIIQGAELKDIVVAHEKLEKRETILKLIRLSVADVLKASENTTFIRSYKDNTIRCTRGGASVTFIDGIRVAEITKLPGTYIDEPMEELRGVSAQYENEKRSEELTSRFIDQ